MTDLESIDIGRLSADLFPKSSRNANLIASLVDATAHFPFAVVKDAMLLHQRDEEGGEFISVPGILRNVRKTTEGSQSDRARDRAQVAQAAAIEARKREAEEKANTDASVTAARDFCERHADRLPAWRAEVEAKFPIMAAMWKQRETMGSVSLICTIYNQFGRVPREVWEV